MEEKIERVAAGSITLKLRSWLLTAVLAIAFALFLKEDTRATLAFFGLPGLLSSTTWQAVVALVAMLFLFVYAKRVGLDLFGGLILCFGAFALCSTIYNQGNASVLAIKLLPCIASTLIVAALAKDYSRNLLQAMFLASIFYVLCNLIFLLQRPDLIGFDTTESLFFSYRNSTFRVTIPAFTCSLLLDNMDGRKISFRTVTVYGLGLLELLVGYSATAVLAFVFMGLGVLVSLWKRLRKCINGMVAIALYILFFVVLVIFRFQNSFSFLIEQILGRSLTFTGRTYIWDQALALLQGKTLLFGYGSNYLQEGIRVDWQLFQHAHNEILNILMLGGLCSLAVLSAAVLLAGVRLYKMRASFSTACISASGFAIALISLVEATTYPMSFFLLAFAWYGLASDCSLSRACLACDRVHIRNHHSKILSRTQ